MVISTSFSYGRKGSDIVSAFLSAPTAHRAVPVLMPIYDCSFRIDTPPCGNNASDCSEWRMCYGVHFRVRRLSGDEVEKLAHLAELVVAGVEDFLQRLVGKRGELAIENFIEQTGCRVKIGVGAALRLANDFV